MTTRNFLPLTLAFFPGLGACAATVYEPPPPEFEESIAAIADRLVETAKLRTDLRGIRAQIYEMHPASTDASAAAQPVADERRAQRIGRALEAELVLQLASRIYVVDDQTGGRGLGEAERFGATHVLRGDFVLGDDELMLIVRLVDVDTRLIVAATRGSVPLRDLDRAVETPMAVAAAPPIAVDASPQAGGLGLPAVAAPESAHLVAGEEALHPGLPDDFEAWSRRRAAGETPPSPDGIEDFGTWSGRRLPAETPLEAEIGPHPGGVEDFEAWRSRAFPAETPLEVAPDPGEVEDFEAWRKRRFPAKTPLEAEPPSNGVEDFDTWRRRRLPEGEASPPPGRADDAEEGPGRRAWGRTPVSPFDAYQKRRLPSLRATRPWRTAQLAQLLGIPAEPIEN